MNILTKLSLSVTTLFLLALPVLAGPPLGQMHGGGQGLLTDDAGRQYPISFAIAATGQSDSSGVGTINFVFRNEFAADWGAVPGVELIHVWGHVTSVTIGEGGTVILAGEVTEKDFSTGEGLVYLEEGVPFSIVIGGSLGPGEFILQWCMLPEFPVDAP